MRQLFFQFDGRMDWKHASVRRDTNWTTKIVLE